MAKRLEKNAKLGLWHGMPLSSTWAWVVILIVAFASIRGMLVINLNASLNAVKAVSVISLMLLTIYGALMMRTSRHSDLAWLKNLLVLNILLGGLNQVFDLLLGVPFDLSVWYLYCAPFVTFLFLRVPTYYFNALLFVVTIAIGGSVIGNFVESISGPEGYANVIEYNTILKPDEGDTFGRSSTGKFLRASGYTGNPHDSANILGMMVSFFFVRFLIQRKFLDLFLCAFAIIPLFMTQSATNILVAVFIMISSIGYVVIKRRTLSTWLALIFMLIGMFVLMAMFGEVMAIFTARVDAGGDWAGMANKLDASSWFSAVPFLFYGHAAGFGSDVVDTEVAHLKILLQLGVFHAAILFCIMLYPLWGLAKNKRAPAGALPSAAAIFFGFMSLLHYGSTFRVTSVFLFYVFVAICLNHQILKVPRPSQAVV